MTEWSDLRVVIAVERHRTLTAAARALNCDQSTVTRRLAAAQASLGARLFDRRDGAYVFNEAGERLRAHLAAVEENALAIERLALGEEASPRGVVRLTTVETLSSRFLAPHLAKLRERHPAIELEVDVDHRTADLARREADLALRLARPRQAQLVARRVGEIGLALYASHAYLEAHGKPKLGEGLAGHTIVADDETNSWTEEARFLARKTPGARVSLRCRSWLSQVSAAEAGLGIALLPCFIADASPALRRLEKRQQRCAREIWLIVHRDLQRVARVRVVLDALATAIEENAAKLGGR